MDEDKEELIEACIRLQRMMGVNIDVSYYSDLSYDSLVNELEILEEEYEDQIENEW